MIDDCWHLATTAKGKHEWMILSHSPKMSQIYVASFCEDIWTACRSVSMALAFQQHLMHNNHNGTHIVMHWKTWKQKTSLSALKALSQGMFPVKKCITCITSYYPTFRVRKSFRRFGAAMPRRLGSEQKDSKTRRVSAPLRAVENQSRILTDSFCSTILTSKRCFFFLQEYDRVSLIEHILSRSWNNAWGFPAFLLRRHRCDSGV